MPLLHNLRDDSMFDIGHPSGWVRNRYHYYRCRFHGIRGGGANCCVWSKQHFMCRKDENDFRMRGQELLDAGQITEVWFAEQLELLEANVWGKKNLDPIMNQEHRYCRYHGRNEPVFLCGACQTLHCCDNDSSRCDTHPSYHANSMCQVQQTASPVNNDPGEDMDTQYSLYTAHAYNKETGDIHDVTSPLTARSDRGAAAEVLKQLILVNNEFDVDDPNLVVIVTKL